MIRPVPAALVLGLGTLVSHGFGLSLLPAMLPRIAEDFGAGYGVLGSVAAIGLVAYTAGALGASWMMERLPARTLFIATLAVGGAGLAAAGAATSPLGLTGAAVVLGAAAPVSWAVSLHIAAAAVRPGARAAVMTAAAAGAALGVLINGVLVQTSADLHSWRASFVIAAMVAIAPMGWGWRLFAAPIAKPTRPAAASPAAYRQLVASRVGRVVVGAAVVAGAIGWPFTVFLTATALDEMGVGDARAAALWWLIGVIGTLGGPVIGRYGDRASPLTALSGGAVAFAAGLAFLAVTWTYAGLVAASIGLAVLYYPIWGLVGAVASQHFDARTAMRAISLGLVGAALFGAGANAAAGAWIEASGSFRGPAIAMAVLMAVTAGWQATVAVDARKDR